MRLRSGKIVGDKETNKINNYINFINNEIDLDFPYVQNVIYPHRINPPDVNDDTRGVSEVITNILSIFDSCKNTDYNKMILIYEMAVYIYKLLSYNNQECENFCRKFVLVIIMKLSECIILLKDNDELISSFKKEYLIPIYKIFLDLRKSKNIS